MVSNILSYVWMLCAFAIVGVQGIQFVIIVCQNYDWYLILTLAVLGICAQKIISHLTLKFHNTKKIATPNKGSESIDKKTHRLAGVSTTKGIAMLFVAIIHSHDVNVLETWWVHRTIIDKAVPILLICVSITAFHHASDAYVGVADRFEWSRRRISKLVLE